MRIVALLFLLLISSALQPDSFRLQQKKNIRVKEAYIQNESALKAEVAKLGLSWPVKNIFLRVFKQEKELELWGLKSNGTYILIENYSICASSGDPGPKRKEGDYQVPEGFYKVDRFNPYSTFHLSLGLNYPNSSDRILSDKKSPGGDIFIHGSCVSIGCMAIQDEFIKKLYLYAVESKNAGNVIPVHIFPCRMNSKSYTELKEDYTDNTALLNFWTSLEAGFNYFEKNKKLPSIKVNSSGKYYLNS